MWKTKLWGPHATEQAYWCQSWLERTVLTFPLQWMCAKRARNDPSRHGTYLFAACQNLLAEFHSIHTSHVRRPIKTDSIPMGASTLASRFVQKSPQMLICQTFDFHFQFYDFMSQNNPFLIPFLADSFKKKIARYCSILFHWTYIKKK